MNKKDFLTFDEISVKETSALISLAHSLKKKRIQTSTQLKGKTLAMIFEKPSTRTRVSFEVGMYQLGGHAITLSSDSMQLSRGESHADVSFTDISSNVRKSFLFISYVIQTLNAF